MDETTPPVPLPPADAQGLASWAQAHGVDDRLDDVLVGADGPLAGSWSTPSSAGLTYREVLLVLPARGERISEYVEDTAVRLLVRMAELKRTSRARATWLAEHGQPPGDPVLAEFLVWLRQARLELERSPDVPRRPEGTFEPLRARVSRDPLPMVRYAERRLRDAVGEVPAEESVLLLLGWQDGPPRFASYAGDRAVGTVPPERQLATLDAAVELLLDPRRSDEQQVLAELLQVPAWRHALGTLDEELTRLQAQQPARTTGRVGYKVTPVGAGGFRIEPLLQKRGRGGAYSKGARLDWHQLADDDSLLTEADRRAFRAYDNRFARGGRTWGGGKLVDAQVFGILRALIDHPAVVLAGDDDRRLDIRQGRLRVRFEAGRDGDLTPHFDLMGVRLSAPEVAEAARDGRHVMHLHRNPGGDPQLLLAAMSAQAGALVQALALAPGRFPPEAHDALATRLEALQETVDIEFPSRWTRTITTAETRITARLDLLASGALQVRLTVRPVPLGPSFAPGDGPALLLEGKGRDRHGVRRELAAERQAARDVAERLGLGGGEELEPWCWRVAEGDPALHVVATLKDMADEVPVEWADGEALVSAGSVGRSEMRVRVSDRRDWFAVEGGAQMKGQLVPLADLLAAIREERRYVRIGPRTFVRLEEALRHALARADAALFETRGTFEIAGVGADALTGLVEAEAQIEASIEWTRLRRRMNDSAALPVTLPAVLEATLRPYQRQGVEWMARLAHWGAGAVLADEMGLGKTIQTVALLQHRAPLGPALVVAPTSVGSNWVDEAAKFTPDLKVWLHRGVQRHRSDRAWGPGDLVITSYAIAAMDVAALSTVPFASLVLDEAQAVKNPSTERSKALRQLQASWTLALTGTPIENHLGELWSLFRIVSPGVFGSWERFRSGFAVPIEKFGDADRRERLSRLLQPFVLRRTKAQVARQLPSLTQMVRVVDLAPDERQLYDQLRASTLDELAQVKRDRDRNGSDLRFTLLASLTRLRQLCCHPRLVYPRTAVSSSKTSHLLEMLNELREGGHRALVFSQFRSFLDLLAPRLRQHGHRTLVLDGTTPADQRDQRVAAFQAGDADVFLISLKAGGFGLNLTAADYVIHLDPWWNPAVEEQATARAHRMGQTRPVTAIRLVARDTVEEAVLELHGSKRALAASVLDGADAAVRLTPDQLVTLIRRGGSNVG